MPTEPITLQRMLDVAGNHARTILVEKQQESLLPLFDLRDVDGQGYIVGGEFRGDTPAEVIAAKDAVAAFVRRLCGEHKIVQYSFLSEAWMIKRKEWIEGVTPPPSEADDRVEVVIATATDGKDYICQRWLIKRQDGKVIDLVPDGLTDKIQPSGRFDKLLDPQS